MSGLVVSGLRKSFGGLTAVDDMALTAGRGEVVGLVGPNGAGKTTVINLLTGFYAPDDGAIAFDGQEYTGANELDISRLGVTRTFQNVRLFPGHDAVTQVASGMSKQWSVPAWKALWFSRAERAERMACRDRAEALLDRVGVADRTTDADKLPYGVQRRVEIARALATGPGLVLLDEPTAGMNADESTEIGDLVRSIAADGIAVVLVDHNIPLISTYCDRAVAMSFGRLLAEGEPSAVFADATVEEAYFGRR